LRTPPPTEAVESENDAEAVGDETAEDEAEVGDDILGTDPAAVSLATTRVRARFSDLRRSFSDFCFGICWRGI
jgi:hypothetical protein